MQTALKRRMQFFKVEQPTLALALLPPTIGPMILEGKASSTSTDLQRTRFMPRCFTWPNKVDLRFIDTKQLRVRLTTFIILSAGELLHEVIASHSLARRTTHFSIAASVHDWKMINPDTSEFYAEVYSATIAEVSLTPSPCAPDCKVLKREPAQENSFVLVAAKLNKMKQLAEEMRR